jgi:hypothetical protein
LRIRIQEGSSLGAFSQLYINFQHEKRCIKKCFMMEGKQKQVSSVKIEDTRRVADLYSFDTDPDPAFYATDPDPDPGF